MRGALPALMRRFFPDSPYAVSPAPLWNPGGVVCGACCGFHGICTVCCAGEYRTEKTEKRKDIGRQLGHCFCESRAAKNACDS